MSVKRWFWKIIWAVVIVAIMMVLFIRKGEKVSPIELKEPETAIEIVAPVTSAFRGGEWLKLRVKYLAFIPAGVVTIKVEEVSYQGKETYHLVADAETSRLFSFFCKFRSIFESYMDARNLYSLRSEEHTRSRRNINERFTIYDQEDGIAETSEKGKSGGRKLKIGKNTQDFLSALYFLRTRELETGKNFEINLNDRKRNYKVEIEILRKENIKVPAGRFAAYVAEAKATRKDKDQPGITFTIWLSDDDRKLPLLIKAATRIGPMKVFLMDYGYGGKQN